MSFFCLGTTSSLPSSKYSCTFAIEDPLFGTIGEAGFQLSSGSDGENRDELRDELRIMSENAVIRNSLEQLSAEKRYLHWRIALVM